MDSKRPRLDQEAGPDSSSASDANGPTKNSLKSQSVKRNTRRQHMVSKFLAEIERTALPVKVEGDGLRLPPKDERTPDQQQLAGDLLMLALAWPGYFATLRKRLRERGS